MTTGAFEHFVMTRFNIRYRETDPRAGDEWLRDRLALFCRYSLPAMHSQTVAPDRWMVLCDSESPDWFKKEITELLPEPFEPVWVDGFFSEQVASTLVQGRRRPGRSHVITTRIDNDDAISPDFVSLIQQQFRGQEFEFVNLTRGAQLDGGQVYAYSDWSNPFISLVEVADGTPPRTVWIDEHGHLDRYGQVRQVKTHPAWLQVVHGANLGNSILGVRVHPRRVLEHFAVDVTPDPVSAWQLLHAKPGGAMRVGRRALGKARRVASAGWRRR